MSRAILLCAALVGCATDPPPAPQTPECPPPPPIVYSKDCVLKSEVMNLIDRIHAETDESQAKLDELERALAALRNDVAQALEASLKSVPAGQASVAVVGGKVRVRLSDQLLFQSGSARITPDGYHALDEVSAVLKRTPTRRIEIAGHTDSNRVHKGWVDNWQLSSERARQVLLYLQARGLEGRRLMAAGYGDTDPIDTADSDAARARNRRVELFVEPIASGGAGDDDDPKSGAR